MGDEAALLLADGKELPLRQELTIGRDDDSGLVLDNPTVSRRHAVVAPREGRWCLTDEGSFNGTLLNGHRVPPGFAVHLRHGDRIVLGSEVVIFHSPAAVSDPLRTDTLEVDNGANVQLSYFQRQVVGCLCARWLDGATLDDLPSNEEIARDLGTPGATDAVKAALRRAYAKAGLRHGAVYAKRRALCRIARQRGWI